MSRSSTPSSVKALKKKPKEAEEPPIKEKQQEEEEDEGDEEFIKRRGKKRRKKREGSSGVPAFQTSIDPETQVKQKFIFYDLLKKNWFLCWP